MVQLVLAAQEQLAIDIASQMLGERYYRLNRGLSPEQKKAIPALDRTSEKATNTLLALADEAWEMHRSQLSLRAFFKSG
jgi:hypothetical protein